ncbi:MAG TPA: cupredoxin domain-containing protein [Stellaceae bacterium]|nr:cupredoxin domain-containing protein [Stellaceae bacterium]
MRSLRHKLGVTLLAAILMGGSASVVLADDPVALDLIIKNHLFEPAELTAPAGKRVVIKVKNLDPTAEEFESTSLKIEKVIAGGGEGTVRTRALDPGRYEFIGEYHSATAKGTLVVQ